MNVREVADQLEVAERTVRRWIASGRLRGNRVGSRWTFSQSDVDNFLGSPTTQSKVSIRTTPPDWIRKSEEWLRYRNFVNATLDKKKPKNVIVLDRRGAKAFEWLSPNDYQWGENVWHDSVLHCLPRSALSKMCAEGAVYVFDEMVQHGRAFKRIRDLLEPLGGNVGTYALVGRRSLYMSGKLSDPLVQVCDDLDDPDFFRAVASLTANLNSHTLPLDVDHLVTGGRILDGTDLNEVISGLFRFGSVGVVPRDDGAMIASEAVTLDRPSFFDVNALATWPHAVVDWSGPCKLRFYFNWNERTYTVAAVTFPRISIDTQPGESVIDAARTQPWLANLAGHLAELATERAAELLYLTYSLEASCQLLRQAYDVGLFRTAGLENPNLASQLNRKSFIAALGPVIGKEAYECARRTLGVGPEDNFQGSLPLPSSKVVQLAKSTSKHDHIAKRSLDTHECRNSILSLLKPAGSNVVESCVIPWRVLVTSMSNTYTESTASLAVDWLLDQGPVKPVVLVKNLEDQLVLERGLRRGEFGSWFEHGSNVLGNHDALLRAVLSLSAVATNRLATSGSKDTGSLAFAKVMVNVQHDWDIDRLGGPLYAGWWPYLHGPVPIVPIPRQPGGGYQLLSSYAVKAGYLVEMPTPHGPGRRLAPVPIENLDWLQEYKSSFDPYQRNYLDSLLDCYARIRESARTSVGTLPARGSSIDPLTTLASVRSQKVAYICGYQEIEIWSSLLLESWLPLRRMLISGRTEESSITSLFKKLAQPPALLRAKLDDYATIHEFRRQLAALADQTGNAIMEMLAESVDPAPVFGTQPPYPVGALQRAQEIASDFTSMIRERLSSCGLASDDRRPNQRIAQDGSSKDATYYWRRLIKNAPHLGRLAVEMEALCASNKFPTENEIDLLGRAIDLIRRAILDEEFLPNPLADINRAARSESYTTYLRAVKEFTIDNECGLLVADVRNLFGLSRLVRDLAGHTELSDECAREQILTQLQERISVLAKDLGALVFERISDTLILAFRDADTTIRAARRIQEETTRWIETYDDRQFACLSQLRFGADWYVPSTVSWMDSDSWVVAYALCEENRLLAGEMLITAELYSRLSAENAEYFDTFPGSNMRHIPRSGAYKAQLV